MPNDTTRPEDDQPVNPDAPEEQPSQPEAEAKEEEPIDWEDQAKKLRRENQKRRERAEQLEAELEALRKKEQDQADAEKQQQGKFKELYEEKKSEVDKALAEATEWRTKYEELEGRERDRIMGELKKVLPKDKLDKYEGMPIEILSDIAEDFAKRPAVRDNDPANPRNAEPKHGSLMTPQEMMDIKASNPTLYKKKLRERGEGIRA